MNITFQKQSGKADSPHINNTEGTKPHRAQEKTGQKTGHNKTGAVNLSFSAGEGGLDILGVMGDGREGHDKAKTLTQLQQEAS